MNTPTQNAAADLRNQFESDIVLLSNLIRLQVKAAIPSEEWLEYHTAKSDLLNKFVAQLIEVEKSA